jgi:hypothetical protein
MLVFGLEVSSEAKNAGKTTHASQALLNPFQKHPQ